MRISSNRIVELMAVPAAAHDIDWLKATLQSAIELEFATIPPYLCAYWSIKSGINPAALLIRTIAFEEMLHFGLACNLLSCSQSRTWTQTLVSGKTGTRLNKQAHTAGGRDQRRRLNKLSCAGWLPHDRGFRLGLPRSRSERRLRPAHTGREDSLTVPCLPRVSAWRCGWYLLLCCYFVCG
jgi:hypothetical protein